MRLLVSICVIFASQVQAADSIYEHDAKKGNAPDLIKKQYSTTDALSCEVNDEVALNNTSNELVVKRQKLASSVDEGLLKSCVITEEEANRRILSGSMTLIDIRSSDEFHRYRVTNSINLPSYAVKLKSHLKSKHLLLIGDKVDLVELALLCRDLRKQGFKKVNFVKNGLENWQGKFIGASAASVDEWLFGRIAPREFTSLKSKINWLILDVTGEGVKNKESRFIYEGTEVISFNMTSGDSLERVKRFVYDNSDKYLYAVLVVSKRGEDYSKYNHYLQSNGIKNVFFMQGGLDKYTDYLLTRQAFLARLKRGPARQRSCSGT